jgi:hypothetical protein
VSADNSFVHRQKLLSPVGRKGWIYWPALTVSEKVVSLNITLIPLWWISGLYPYWPGLICLGIIYFEWARHHKVRLSQPTFMVGALLFFCTYQCIGLLLFALATKLVSATAMTRVAMFWFPPTFLLWYVQSHRIPVRFQVLAWACSILALEMLAFWVVGQVILGGGAYEPPRSLFSMLSGNASGSYHSGKGLTNYLIPYLADDASILGSARWNYFFVIPELAAVVSAFIALIALDIEHQKWRIGLFAIGAFLVLMSGTRSVWISLPLIIALRYTYAVGQKKGYLIPLILLAIASFCLLATPSVTQVLYEFYTQASASVSSYRGLSTDVRGDIYAQTIARIPDRMIFGHWVRGESLLYGSELARVGSHSFILGSLLYRSGLVGTLLFLSFWTALAVELFKTRPVRPMFGPCIFVLYTLLSVPMEFGVMPAVMVILVSTMVYLPVKLHGLDENNLSKNSFGRNHFSKNNADLLRLSHRAERGERYRSLTGKLRGPRELSRSRLNGGINVSKTQRLNRRELDRRGSHWQSDRQSGWRPISGRGQRY